jgi:Ca-activated chloride channel homolog
MNMNLPSIECIPLRAAVAQGMASELDVLIRISAPKIAVNQHTERPSLNLGLVIDRSGSMSGERIDRAREAAASIVERLQPSDRVSVTIFDDEVETIVPSIAAAQKRPILKTIGQIQTGGSTDLHAGWTEGGTQVATHMANYRLNRVMLLTDGHANCGVTSPKQICDHVRTLSQHGVSTTVLGVGDDYNEDLLASIASAAEGGLYHIDAPGKMRELFERELGRLSRTVGQVVRLGLEPQSGATVQVLNELELNKDGRLKLGDLVIDEPLQVVARLSIPVLAGGIHELCRFRLTWTDVATGNRHKLRVSLQLPAVPAVDLGKYPDSIEVVQQVALQRSAQFKKQAIEALARQETEAALLYDQEALGMLAQAPPSEEIDVARRQIDKQIEQIAQGDVSSARKAASAEHYYQSRGRRSE